MDSPFHWQLTLLFASAVSSLEIEPPIARLDAFIKAIRKAPVKLGPRPRWVAMAGIKISEANAKLVPNNKEPELLFGLRAATCLLLMDVTWG